ncbi:MAG: O-antigen ligase family protein [Planctomycetaceae bacterium]|nr:O-antigen ligase family protein [Planctomycetaceae bacterium]
MILLLLGYMWLYIHRPFEIWHRLGDVAFERMYILTCAILWFFLHKKSCIRNINVLGVFVVTAAILISDFMTNTTGKMNPVVEEWLKIMFFTILLMTCVRDETELRVLLVGFTVIFFGYMLHSFYEFKVNDRFVYRMGIPRLCGIGETMSDPNSFSASIVYFLPVLVPIWMVMRGIAAIPVRLFVIAAFSLAVICITYTGSRSAFVGLLAYIFLAVAVSKNRWKILAASAVLLPIIWGSMDQRLQNRYMTLIDPSRGPKNAQASAEGRIEGFKVGMELYRKSPVYGFGPGNAQHYISSKLQTHNFLGQVAGEMGSIGLAAYAFLCFCFTTNYLYSRFYWKILTTRCPTADPWLFQVSQAIFLALILLLLMGLGSHNAFRYTWVWYAMFQSMAVAALKKKTEDYIREQNEIPVADTIDVSVSGQTAISRPVPQTL